jgi:hypothetical protein
VGKKEKRRAMRGTGPKPIPRNPTRPINRGRQASRPHPRSGARPAYNAAARRPLKAPTLKRSATTGAVLAVLLMIVTRFTSKTPAPALTYVIIGVGALVLYTGIVYYMQRYLYNKQLRKQQGSPK